MKRGARSCSVAKERMKSGKDFTQRSSMEIAPEQAASDRSQSLLQEGAAQPVVSMPGIWQTHCSGCNIPAPETEPHDATGKRSTAGCRCLMCPEWFACLACADKEASAHQGAHPNEAHVTYSVAPEDEQGEPSSAAASTMIPRWAFAFEALIWPFLKMFVPSVSVLLQVAMSPRTCATRIAFHALLQMFFFLISVRCSFSSSDRTDNNIRACANGGVYSFYVGFIGIILISTIGACEILIFEMMLLSSIYVDCCTPTSKSVFNLKWFLSFLIIFSISYFGFTSATIAFAAASLASIDSAQTLSFRKQAVAIILNNVLALAGGVYFLWTLHFNSFAYGRNSIVSLREQNKSNAKKISVMKCVAISQAVIAVKAFAGSREIAKRKFANNTCSSEQLDALVERLCSPPHLLAACLQLTPENVVAIQTAVIDSSCCTNLRRVMFDVDTFYRFLRKQSSLLYMHHRFVKCNVACRYIAMLAFSKSPFATVSKLVLYCIIFSYALVFILFLIFQNFFLTFSFKTSSKSSICDVLT